MTHEKEQIVIHNVQVPDRRSGILTPAVIRDGRCSFFFTGRVPESQPHRVIDAEGVLISRAFIDIHTHGGAGADTMDADINGLRRMSAFYALHGVGSFMPTTMTMEPEQILAAIRTVADYKQVWTPKDGARPLGVHLEGPYISALMAGAQPKQWIQTGESYDCIRFFDACPGVVRMITLAPEIEGNRVVIEEAVKRNITVVAGHTSASYDEMVRAQRLGVSQATHTWNQMTIPHHRSPGTVGAALTLADFYAQLISDGMHIHPAMIDLSIRVRGTDHIVLITDSVRGAGMPDGDYELGGQPIVVKDGAVYLKLEEGVPLTLAGSSLTLDVAVKNAHRFTGLPVATCLQMATVNPAMAVGMPELITRKEEWTDDVVLLDPDTLEPIMTIIGGEIVYERPAA